ncbi:MAG TPA: hybrid sensor histidine kinase/response regulator, partial [Terriglobales bacterium]|nr:hybrid sensor histidine kinase/response regulator [Terriglobales bacterium]
IGRPLRAMTHGISLPDIEALAVTVVSGGAPFRGQAQDAGGRDLTVRIDADAETGGAVLLLGAEPLVSFAGGAPTDIESKYELIGMLAHELRNPLVPLLNVVHMLDGEANLAWARAMIERQIRKLGEMIDDLSDVARASRGRIELERQPVDLAHILERAVDETRPGNESRHQHVTLQLPARPLLVEGDSERLAQVFRNLLQHASKSTPSGGAIAVRAEAAGETVEVRVCDNGYGITAEQLQLLFEPFGGSHGSVDRRGGLSMALALARALVELHGGSIRASSAGTGQGSEIVVELPLAQVQPAAEPTPARDEIVSAEDGSKRILIVEDNADAAASMAMALRKSGYDIELVRDGAGALQRAASFHPRVILLDIGLPEMDGFEVARQLRRDPATAEALIIAVTGYGTERDRRRGREAGFDHHLVKPIDLNHLRDLIRKEKA